MKNKSNRNSTLRFGSIVAVLLALLPYLFFSYEAFPEDFWNIGWLNRIKEDLGGDAYITGWIIMQKLVPAVLLAIWFISCKHWWYHVIAIPFSMYLFQLIVVFTPFFEYLDHFEIYFVIPIVIISLSLSYLARIKIYDKIHDIDLTNLEEQITKPSDKLFNKND